MSDESAGGLAVRHLTKHFRLGGLLSGKRQVIQAVTDVSLDVPPGESVGLVGESGCGKSTVSRAILRLTEPDAGEVVFDGVDIRQASRAALRKLRQRLQFIFQDPYSSLNQRRSIRKTLEEPLRVHRLGTRAEIREKAEAAIAEVGLPLEALDRYPHEFSGGQRQRIGIARALVLNPELVVADEPVSALDVSVQAQILTLLDKLKAQRGLSFLFVSHDLGVVRHFCGSVCVMYLGRIVETGPTKEVLDAPAHPYTQLLRESSPVPDPTRRLTLIKNEGEIPSPADPPRGCAFHTRCPHRMPVCGERLPELKAQAPGRKVACHLFD
ncbi:ATP-binding cassette domain-containing protein [Pelagibius litoralis]|uniref:ATP-binding cassette domain-containing protein n=1 Tax=Pelagibius litoralis TaxID=374515 RepID=A0A967KHM4_9PROT|nr:oligopeptide/dipeptide ABC transporter ATP-binding protein [Pelagibius litoralis]NIA71416.1 ATP-binding cassette domain-containing protein [Pelagibius litoralis]